MKKEGDPNSNGARLRALRANAGLTLQQLGEHGGVTKSALSKYESGILQPSDKILGIYADLAGVGIDEMRKSFPKKPKGTDLDGLEHLHPTAKEALLSLEKSSMLFKRAGVNARGDAAEIVKQGELTEGNVEFLFEKQKEGAFYETVSETVEEALARVREALRSYTFPTS